MSGRSVVDFSGERRIHVGLAVRDLEDSRRFYEALLGVRPTKVRAGYVKFEPADPPVNLSLNEVGEAARGGDEVTHFGVQVKSSQAVQEARARLAGAGLATTMQDATACCYAVQDKVWVSDPDGHRWEVFVVLADAEQRKDADSACCADSSRATDRACC